MKIEIYTDGACSGNGKANAKGGWAAALLFDGSLQKSISGAEDGTTNQRMELLAAISGLEALTDLAFVDITLYTDSAYLCNCWKDKWWVKWISNGWTNSKKEPVANQELWERLIPFFKLSNFEITKVKGHGNDKWNNYVDELAVAARTKPKI